MRVRGLVLTTLGISLAAILAAGRPAAAQVSQGDFDTQLAKLGDEDAIADRDAAETQLTAWAVGNMLSAQQLGALKSARSQTPPPEANLERAARAKRIFSRWIATRPLALGLLNGLRVRVSFYIGGRVIFELGNAEGAAPIGSPIYAELAKRYQAFRNAVLAGETQPGPGGGPDPITAAANALRSYINGLTQEAFDSLDLENPLGSPFTKQQILDSIDNQLQKIPAVKNDIGQASGGDDPDPAARVHVPAGIGVQPEVGRSLALAIAMVSVAGQLDEFWVMEPDTLSRPPAGFEFVGSVYDFLADGTLAVSGPIQVSIEYGPSQTIGNPVLDPNLLQVVRFANGNFEILPLISHDLVNHVITAGYVPAPVFPGFDAFGEFAVIQPAPPAVPALHGRGKALLALVLVSAAARILATRTSSPSTKGRRQACR